MGGARNQRSRNSLTFLEHVCDLLHSLQADIDVIKSSIECINIDRQVGLSCQIPYHESLTTLDDLRPPVAPPPLDMYDRNFLLCFRGVKDGSLEHTLVKTSPIEDNSFTTMDWDSLKFEMDEFDAPPLPARVWYEPDEITAFVTEVSNTTEETSDDKQSVETRKQDALLKSIWNAQHNAKRRRWNEDRRHAINKPVQVIQGFWRTCKSKLANRVTEANRVEVNTDKAKLATNFPVHVGSCGTAMDSRVRGAVHKTPMLNSNSLYSSADDQQYAMTSMQNEYWINQSELTAEPRTDKDPFLQHAPEDSASYRIGDDKEEVIAKTICEEPDDIDCNLKCILDLINEFSGQIPSEGQTAFIFNAFRGLAERKNLDKSEYFAMLKRLETHLGTRMEVSLPFVCMQCSWRYEKQEPQCHRCAGTDIYDERRCVCNHLGICNIGSCCASESDEDYSDNFVYIKNLTKHYGREITLRCDYCNDTIAPDDDCWLCNACKSCIVHAESYAKCKERHLKRHAPNCHENSGRYLLKNLERKCVFTT